MGAVLAGGRAVGERNDRRKRSRDWLHRLKDNRLDQRVNTTALTGPALNTPELRAAER